MLLLRTLYRYFFFFLMILRPPRSTRTDTLFPYTTLFRSDRPEDDAGIAYPDGRLGYDRHAVAGTHEPNQVLAASEMLIDVRQVPVGCHPGDEAVVGEGSAFPATCQDRLIGEHLPLDRQIGRAHV